MPGISSRVKSRSRTPSSRRRSEVNRTVVPFGSALERRSRTTYRPTVTPEGSTHVDTFTGTTSSFSRTASGKVAVAAVVRRQVFTSESERFREPLGQAILGHRGIDLDDVQSETLRLLAEACGEHPVALEQVVQGRLRVAGPAGDVPQ